MENRLKAGSFDGDPFFCTPSEAWVLSGGKWGEVNAADVGRNGVVLSPAAFGKRFGSLPELPKTAFHSSESAARVRPNSSVEA